ncbi:UNKNOWN [Stylonychia lemnae]|uniref:Uncharacterized protein n=1 Tax=Stylonychia lemnae TaxID=5949 RepID=A0A078AKT0_STYLE|nr:UNKNOWN [Stylonychia lemnae]|eukprot:CDW82814.1 UNKNOWN [Stylonychia lemnae]
MNPEGLASTLIDFSQPNNSVYYKISYIGKDDIKQLFSEALIFQKTPQFFIVGAKQSLSYYEYSRKFKKQRGLLLASMQSEKSIGGGFLFPQPQSFTLLNDIQILDDFNLTLEVLPLAIYGKSFDISDYDYSYITFDYKLDYWVYYVNQGKLIIQLETNLNNKCDGRLVEIRYEVKQTGRNPMIDLNEVTYPVKYFESTKILVVESSNNSDSQTYEVEIHQYVKNLHYMTVQFPIFNIDNSNCTLSYDLRMPIDNDTSFITFDNMNRTMEIFTDSNDYHGVYIISFWVLVTGFEVKNVSYDLTVNIRHQCVLEQVTELTAISDLYYEILPSNTDPTKLERKDFYQQSLDESLNLAYKCPKYQYSLRTLSKLPIILDFIQLKDNYIEVFSTNPAVAKTYYLLHYGENEYSSLYQVFVIQMSNTTVCQINQVLASQIPNYTYYIQDPERYIFFPQFTQTYDECGPIRYKQRLKSFQNANPIVVGFYPQLGFKQPYLLRAYSNNAADANYSTLIQTIEITGFNTFGTENKTVLMLPNNNTIVKCD